MTNIKFLLDESKITKEELFERLSKKVSFDGLLKDGFTRCWKSLGTLTSGGYGQMMILGISINTHRLSYMLHNDVFDLPKKYVIGHKCDNSECCNPEHLECITYGKNTKDAYDRGCRISYTPKIKIKVSVACENCHNKRCKCVQSGEICERCKELNLVCIIRERQPKKGDFTSIQSKGENNTKCKLSKERFIELVERLKKPIERGKIQEIADKFGITKGYLMMLKTKINEGLELRSDIP